MQMSLSCCHLVLCPDLIRCETITMIPHLHRRLPEHCALPFVRRCRLGKATNKSRHLMVENFCVELERLLGEDLRDEVTRRCISLTPTTRSDETARVLRISVSVRISLQIANRSDGKPPWSSGRHNQCISSSSSAWCSVTGQSWPCLISIERSLTTSPAVAFPTSSSLSKAQ